MRWTAAQAPGCGDTLKDLAGDQRLISGGDRHRRRLQGRYRLGHRPVVLLRTETAQCTARPIFQGQVRPASHQLERSRPWSWTLKRCCGKRMGLLMGPRGASRNRASVPARSPKITSGSGREYGYFGHISEKPLFEQQLILDKTTTRIYTTWRIIFRELLFHENGKLISVATWKSTNEWYWENNDFKEMNRIDGNAVGVRVEKNSKESQRWASSRRFKV